MGRLLVSVRGPNEALAAAQGGAHIVDVEDPRSALGTSYPLNIKAVFAIAWTKTATRISRSLPT